MAAQYVVNGRYEIRATLGQGGMGIVFRAYDTSTKRDVALKTMRGGADQMTLGLFAKEWTVLARLSHPNIVDILDSGEFDDGQGRRPFFVMPLLPGRTLDELIKNSSQRLTVERTVEILVQTCRGLQAAHEQGLVHRDLKPSNIFVMDDDTAKIIDFGVVHLTGTESISGIKGTLQYMAPEQLEMKPTTAQSDIFSLGVVAYEALTGRKPFARKTEQETADAVREHIPPPAYEINPAVGEMISRVVHKAMAKQPWHRFDTVREFSETLRKAARNEPIERFERSKILPRIERAKKAFAEGDLQFAHEILSELQAEGNIDPDMGMLQMQLDRAVRQRTIRQLLENARNRFEQDEYPLALQKLQEVLQIDPDNVDALRMRKDIESQRSERQLENWVRLIREHLHGGAFEAARKSIDEALKVSPNDAKVKGLLAEVVRQEEQTAKVRGQQDQLYSAAKQAFQNGEISTALSKLERILDIARATPDRVHPERDAVYQTLYNRVRTEHDAIRASYEEARRELASKEFSKALAVCDSYLKKYPGQAQFQALRLQITEQERQELSASIAETARRLDAEPDLDRKLAIIKSVVERYPNEPHFQTTLNLTRERRDLVLSIVAKARQYEEREQFSEAIGQWQIVQSIYPPYPGLAFEIEQLARRRDVQTRDEAKAELVERVDRAIEAGDFERAQEMAAQAFTEHPEDAELEQLQKVAAEGLERRAESRRLVKEGQDLCSSGAFAEGIAALRSAAELDRFDASVRSTLVNALANYAQVLVKDRWTEAEPLVQEALQIEPDHTVAKSLKAVIIDNRKKHAVTRSLAEARAFHAKGDFEGALRTIDDSLRSYSNDPRLQQLRTSLKQAADADRQARRARDLAELRRLAAEGGASEQPQLLAAALEQGRPIAARYPADPEFQSVIQELERSVRASQARVRGVQEKASAAAAAGAAGTVGHEPAKPPSSEAETVLFSAPPGPAGRPAITKQPANGPSAPAPPSVPPPPSLPKPRVTASVALPPAASGAAVAPPPAPPAKASRPVPSGLPVVPSPPSAVGRLLALPRWQLGSLIGAVVIVLVGLVALLWPRATETVKPPPVQRYTVTIATNTPTARITVDGTVMASPSFELPAGQHSIEVSSEGYKTKQRLLTVRPGMVPETFSLDPEPQRVRVVTALKSGQVVLDGKGIATLTNGEYLLEDVPAGEHTLQVKDGPRDALEIHFRSTAAHAAEIIPPIKTPNLVVVSSLGTQTRVYTGPGPLKVALKDQPLQAAPPEGVLFAKVPPGAQLEAGDGKANRVLPLGSENGPGLSIYAADVTQVTPLLSIVSNVPDPRLFIDGKLVPSRFFNGRVTTHINPGKYKVKLEKPGYIAEEKPVDLTGGDASVTFELKAVPQVASLVIEEGPPGAEVFVDGSLQGTLDARGEITVNNISPGEHDVSIRKALFDSKELKKRVFTAGQALKIQGDEAKLQPFGILQPHVDPPEAQLSYRRETDNTYYKIQNRHDVPLSAGRYRINAKADAHIAHEEPVTIEPGKQIQVSFTLARLEGKAEPPKAPVVPSTLYDSTWTKDSEGAWQYNGQGYGWLAATWGTFNFTVQKKHAKFLGSGSIEWVVGFVNNANKITYRLAKDGTLRRQATVDGRAEAEIKAGQRVGGGETFQFQISIEPNRVVVRNEGGEVMDEYSDTKSDLTRGKFGFRSGVHLTATPAAR